MLLEEETWLCPVPGTPTPSRDRAQRKFEMEARVEWSEVCSGLGYRLGMKPEYRTWSREWSQGMTGLGTGGFRT